MEQNQATSVRSNGRLEWIDVLKCIGMLLVVVGHASQGVLRIPTGIISTPFICLCKI